jgi:lysophospholipase L1-like esterase
MTYQAMRLDPRTSPRAPWRALFRVEANSGLVSDVARGLEAIQPEKAVYAEGDSWFDKFTPIGVPGTNLLDALRAPFLTAVVDVAHIGDEIREMVAGRQARQTRALLQLFSFDAILLSAGGNDLRALFEREFVERTRPWSRAEVMELVHRSRHRDFFQPVVREIGRFFDLRDASRLNGATPILLHGYDYLQPRPAGAPVFAGTRLGTGPWLFPLLRRANLDGAQMRAVADAVIDELNEQLEDFCATRANVTFIDQRGLLAPALPGSEGPSHDWMDEIHPNDRGYAKLARQRWDVLLAQKLGWDFAAEDLQVAEPGNTLSTAVDDVMPAEALFAGWQPPQA